MRVNISPMLTVSKVPKARSRRYRGVDAGARVEERRGQFIEAGLECFGTRGYHAVTVRELCAQAQLTERYFYESFKDREALFAAVYEHLIATLRVDFMAAAAPRAPDLRAMARAGLEVFYRRLKQDPRVARMLLVDVLTVSHEMEQRAMAATFGFGDLLKQMCLAALPGNGAATGVPDMDLISTGLIGACVQIAMRWVADGYRQPLRRVVEASLSFFFAILDRLSQSSTPRS